MENIRSINQLIIHCADTPNGRPVSAEEIDRWHKERGFQRNPAILWTSSPHLKHIGYHLIIGIDGTTTKGRHPREIGAHCKGFNLHSIGVCLIGRDAYTDAQWATLAAIVNDWRRRVRKIAIVGHRDLDSDKTCPGFDVAEWLTNGMMPNKANIYEATQ